MKKLNLEKGEMQFDLIGDTVFVPLRDFRRLCREAGREGVREKDKKILRQRRGETK